MKVGIITVHNVINYGAVFQAFALKEYLLRFLSDSDTIHVINYTPDFLESKKKITFTKNIKADLIETERLLMRNKIRSRNDAFDNFIRRNDSLTAVCKTKEEVFDAVRDYDVLIAGSDQIWNFNITGGDRTYLLDFPEFTGVRMSYASSLGEYRFYESAKAEIADVLKKFTYLSCRETDGCAYISSLTEKPCAHVCDPTLLLRADVYAGLAEGRVRNSIRQLAERDFLLIYNLSNSDDIYSTAKQVADEKRLKIYQIFPSLRKNKVVDKVLNDISPEEFLYLYTKAKFIVTNSFHGTCFSIINRKDFYTVKPTGSNNRLSSMLDETGLSDRLLISGNGLPASRSELTIDYTKAETAIERFTASSAEYLKSALAR